MSQKPVNNGFRLTLNLKPEEFEMLTLMAAQEERPRSWIAQKAIREMFARQFPDENA